MVLFAIQVVVLILAMVLFGIHPDYLMLTLIPLALVALVVFTSAMSGFLSAVNVYLRDTQHLTEVLLMAWFWGTPIVYTWGQISAQIAGHPSLTWLKYAYLCNPVTPIAMTFQRGIYGQTQYTYKPPGGGVLVYHVLPNWGIATYAGLLGLVLAASIGLFLLALIVFGRLEGNFAEEL
jgi:ABC-2 type transport system permease protein